MAGGLITNKSGSPATANERVFGKGWKTVGGPNNATAQGLGIIPGWYATLAY